MFLLCHREGMCIPTQHQYQHFRAVALKARCTFQHTATISISQHFAICIAAFRFDIREDLYSHQRWYNLDGPRRSRHYGK